MPPPPRVPAGAGESTSVFLASPGRRVDPNVMSGIFAKMTLDDCK